MSAAPDVAEVRRIAAIRGPVLRNLEITYCYSRLAAAVAARTGQGANWCTFATWASRQAGATIRGEDALGLLRDRLHVGARWLHPFASLWRWLLRRGLLEPETRLGRLTAQLHTPFDALERTSAAVARGNLAVFAEIGEQFARWLAGCPPDAPPDGPEFQAFVAGLRPGDPPAGQRHLREAFACYQRLPLAADPKAKAELLLLANLLIGLHEQTRLQPDIRDALDAPYATKEDLGRRLLAALFPRALRWPAPLQCAAAAPLAAAGARLQRLSADLAREVVTEALMVLSVPGRILALGRHLDAPFPEDLRELHDRELSALLGRFEPGPPAADDCGATDWSDLRQRMHYIVHLFRAFHATPALFDPPFTPDQVRRIEAGTIPDGVL